MIINTGIKYNCNNGGSIRLIENSDEIQATGVDNGFAFFNDVYINAYNKLSVNVNGDMNAELQYEGGETVIKFNIRSRVNGGKADIQFKNLAEDKWYRLLFNGELAKMDNSSTHMKSNFKKSDEKGTITFNGVMIPDE